MTATVLPPETITASAAPETLSAVPESLTAAPEALTTVLTPVADTVAPVASGGMDLSSPMMLAMYGAAGLAVVVKALIQLLTTKLPDLFRDDEQRVKRTYVSAVIAVCAALAFAAARYLLGWDVEASLILAGGAGGSTFIDLAHRTVVPKKG